MTCKRMVTLLLALALMVTAAAGALAADIRPIPVDYDELDTENGTFRFLVRGADRAEADGGFTAVLYLTDRYDGEQIRALAPGDTVFVNDRKWTVRETVAHHAAGDLELPADVEVITEEDLGEEQYLAFRPLENGTFEAVMGDWNPIVPAGTATVRLPLPEAFAYERNETAGDADTFIRDLALFTNPYNTECEFRDGQMIRVTSGDYPYGPAEPEDGAFRPVPVWKFCHGFRDGLDTAVIEAFTTDCEAGLLPAEMSQEEIEEIRRLIVNGTVTGKENDTCVTGGTWVFTFATPGGKLLLSVEMYKGLIAASDGMYRVE